jgi:hypothetical protein
MRQILTPRPAPTTCTRSGCDDVFRCLGVAQGIAPLDCTRLPQETQLTIAQKGSQSGEAGNATLQ